MAAPNPEDLLDRVERLAKKGLPAVVLVHGPNDFFRNEAVDKLLAAVPADAELRTIDAADLRAPGGAAGDDDDDEGGGDGAEAAESCPELLDLRGGGLFARRSFLLVRRAKNWWAHHAATLAAEVARFAKGSGIVIEAQKLDRRKKVAAQLVKQCTDDGAAFEFRELYATAFGGRDPMQGELAKWIQARGRKLGAKLSLEAACMMIACVGRQPGELVAELQRLRDQVAAEPGHGELSARDLRDRLNLGFESTPFELAEAVLGGDERAAFRSVRAMFARGVRGRDGKPMDTGGLFPFATSWLYQALAKAYEGRTLLDDGVPAEDVAGRLGVRQFVDRFVRELKRNDRDRLGHGLLALHSCQRASRTQGEEPEVLLERFLQQWFAGAPVPRAEDFEA